MNERMEPPELDVGRGIMIVPLVAAGALFGAFGFGVLANELSISESHPTGSSSAFGNGFAIGAMLGAAAGFLAYRAWIKRSEQPRAPRVLADGPAQFEKRRQIGTAAWWVGAVALGVSMWKLRTEPHPMPGVFPWMIIGAIAMASWVAKSRCPACERHLSRRAMAARRCPGCETTY